MTMADISRRFRNSVPWGLRLAPADRVRARVIEQHWRWPTLLALCATIPAFYSELLHAAPPPLSGVAYALAGLMVGAALLHTGWRSGRLATHLAGNPLDLLLAAGLVLSILLPPSSTSTTALVLRLVLAFVSLVRMVWALQHLISRGGLTYLLLLAVLVLGACGVGFWLLEPRTPTLADGLWLAFTTAATVGYGDVVPTTPASKIFAVFVVLLGFGVLTLVTAAIAAHWIETEERTIEHEILRDMHRQIATLRHEIGALREELAAQRDAPPPQPPPPLGGSEREPV
ncbi:potassium channel family protein [Aquabacterium sp.]|uniref:potassium channel family protein n=1 Tax=Aquabacterium sp. TaxID=1872578 RepID=UPI003784A3CC